MSDKLQLVVTPRQTKFYPTFAAKLTDYSSGIELAPSFLKLYLSRAFLTGNGPPPAR